MRHSLSHVTNTEEEIIHPVSKRTSKRKNRSENAVARAEGWGVGGYSLYSDDRDDRRIF